MSSGSKMVAFGRNGIDGSTHEGEKYQKLD